MSKIYNLNGKGSVGVSLNKQMKAAGYTAGKHYEWIAKEDGYLLKLIDTPATPIEASKEAVEAKPPTENVMP
jgi:hypothetical protein